MDLYKLRWKDSAKKELKSLDKKTIQRLLEAIEPLAKNPRPVACKKLQGTDDLYRIRVSNYRVVYSIEDAVLVIEIIRIGHRRDVYQKKFG